MLYKYFAVLAIVFLLIPTLNAQEVDKSGGYARVRALGENPYVVDPEFMKTNPAWGQFYDNFLWADIGEEDYEGDYSSGAGQFFGLNFRLDNQWTLGAIMSRDDYNSVSIGMLDPFGITSSHNPALNNNFELFSSLKLGNTSLGLGLAYASASTENNPAGGESVTTGASQLGVNLGIISSFDRNMMLDLGVNLAMPNYTNDDGEVDISQTIIAANARFFWKLGSKVRLVPAASFMTASGTADNSEGSADLPSYSSFGFGVGMEYTVGEFMFIGGPALRSTSVTDADPEVSSFTFPIWNLGAEWTATEWLIARMGYVAETGSSTTTEEDDDEFITTFYRPGEVSLGIGLRFGGFGLDATVNSSVLRGGLQNIGGPEPTFAYLSASYAF